MSGSRSRPLMIVATAVVLLLALGAVWMLTRSEKLPNIILVSIDTVRADHLSAYSYDRNTSPHLDELARNGVLFENAVSQAPWTLPSLASLHSSLYPSEHNAVGAETALAREVTTLAEALAAEGYVTIGVVAHRFAGRKHGLAQGFTVFDESQNRGHSAVTSEALTKLATGFAADVGEQPYFLWVHYFDPHYSYVRHPEFGFATGYAGTLPNVIVHTRLDETLNAGRLTDDDLEFVQAVYDEEIAHTDRWIGELLAGLPVRNDGRATVTILTADHGEYFLERGRFFHGKDVYRELVSVPLVIGGDLDADLRGSRVGRPVDLVSIPRTVMELVGVRDHGFGGEDLLDREAWDSEPGYAFTEGSYAWGADLRKTAVVFDHWKLIRNHDDATYELYDIAGDQHERTNLWQDEREDVAAVRQHLRDVLKRFTKRGGTAARTIELDEKTVEKLRSLGYVQ